MLYVNPNPGVGELIELARQSSMHAVQKRSDKGGCWFLLASNVVLVDESLGNCTSHSDESVDRSDAAMGYCGA